MLWSSASDAKLSDYSGLNPYFQNQQEPNVSQDTTAGRNRPAPKSPPFVGRLLTVLGIAGLITPFCMGAIGLSKLTVNAEISVQKDDLSVSGSVSLETEPRKEAQK